jgi:hypothetical protein
MRQEQQTRAQPPARQKRQGILDIIKKWTLAYLKGNILQILWATLFLASTNCLKIFALSAPFSLTEILIGIIIIIVIIFVQNNSIALPSIIFTGV